MFLVAFTIGIIGSLHCAAMCGPLMMVNSFQGKNKSGVINALVYHFSRIIAYMILGTLVTSFIESSVIFGWSQWASIGIGAIFIILGFIKIFGGYKTTQNLGKVSSLYSKVLGRTSGVKKFAISGFLNGLLPCGLVFVALSSSALLTNWYDGAIYMMLFGLGTFPAMLFLSIGANTIKNKISIIRIQYFIPYVFLITGGLLLVRGLGIGIPYLSPQFVEQDQKVNCCHAK